jgi:hypothetical protein
MPAVFRISPQAAVVPLNLLDVGGNMACEKGDVPLTTRDCIFFLPALADFGYLVS